MLSSITENAHRLQQRLTRLDNQPLSKAALGGSHVGALAFLPELFDRLQVRNARI